MTACLLPPEEGQDGRHPLSLSNEQVRTAPGSSQPCRGHGGPVHRIEGPFELSGSFDNDEAALSPRQGCGLPGAIHTSSSSTSSVPTRDERVRLQRSDLEHRAEKWAPVFRADDAKTSA